MFDQRGPVLMADVLNGQDWPAGLGDEPFLYFTTVGRRTGRWHRVEMKFAAYHGRLNLRAGSRERADWVRNLVVNLRVTVELWDEIRVGIARVLEVESAEDHLFLELLLGKKGKDEDDLTEWGRTPLPVRIDFPGLIR